MAELLIGCGGVRDKRIKVNDRSDWVALTTLDNNPDHHPDVVHDLEILPLPFSDESFDEIHAYEVLEHTGRQGDYRFFFDQFAEFWRLLRPGGFLCGSVPLPGSPWAWGDPSHTRVLPKESFVFLDQTEYARQVGRTAMSDFRGIYKADFTRAMIQEKSDSTFFVLRVVKPARVAA